MPLLTLSTLSKSAINVGVMKVQPMVSLLRIVFPLSVVVRRGALSNDCGWWPVPARGLSLSFKRAAARPFGVAAKLFWAGSGGGPRYALGKPTVDRLL